MILIILDLLRTLHIFIVTCIVSGLDMDRNKNNSTERSRKFREKQRKDRKKYNEAKEKDRLRK